MKKQPEGSSFWLKIDACLAAVLRTNLCWAFASLCESSYWRNRVKRKQRSTHKTEEKTTTLTAKKKRRNKYFITEVICGKNSAGLWRVMWSRVPYYYYYLFLFIFIFIFLLLFLYLYNFFYVRQRGLGRGKLFILSHGNLGPRRRGTFTKWINVLYAKPVNNQRQK